jgi:hypothetical protein
MSKQQDLATNCLWQKSFSSWRAKGMFIKLQATTVLNLLFVLGDFLIIAVWVKFTLQSQEMYILKV